MTVGAACISNEIPVYHKVTDRINKFVSLALSMSKSMAGNVCVCLRVAKLSSFMRYYSRKIPFLTDMYTHIHKSVLKIYCFARFLKT